MDELKKLVNKGRRLDKGRRLGRTFRLNIPIRMEMADWLKQVAVVANVDYSIIARGFLEDCYDRYLKAVGSLDQEVTE